MASARCRKERAQGPEEEGRNEVRGARGYLEKRQSMLKTRRIVGAVLFSTKVARLMPRIF